MYEDNFDSNSYVNILQDALLENRDCIGEQNVVMQMDNARYHWTNEILKYYEDNNIKVIDWPPYSPDLNPIENLWGIIKGKLKGKTFTTMTSLKNKLINIWEHIELDLVERLCESIYERIEIWIKTKGALTNY